MPSNVAAAYFATNATQVLICIKSPATSFAILPFRKTGRRAQLIERRCPRARDGLAELPRQWGGVENRLSSRESECLGPQRAEASMDESGGGDEDFVHAVN